MERLLEYLTHHPYLVSLTVALLLAVLVFELRGRVEAGEAFVIARAGKPIAMLTAVEPAHAPRPRGLGRGKVIIRPNFDAPPPEFEDLVG